MADGDGGTGSNAVWAIAVVLIVGLIIGAIFYSGVLNKTDTKKVDINVTAPGR
jgi:hypothetical protein